MSRRGRRWPGCSSTRWTSCTPPVPTFSAVGLSILVALAKWANRNLSPDAVLVTPQQQRVRLAEQVLPATIPSVTHLSCDLTADHLAVSDPGAVAACGERPAARRVGDGRRGVARADQAAHRDRTLRAGEPRDVLAAVSLFRVLCLSHCFFLCRAKADWASFVVLDPFADLLCRLRSWRR